MADRSNEQWVSDLKSAGVRQEVALADLREVIKTGLPYALSKYLSSNDPRYDALVEEAAQETLVQVLARIDTFEGRSKFTTWVHTIAVRIALTELRRARWRDVYLEEMTEIKHVQFDTMELPEPEALPEDQVERSDMLVQVRRLIMEELTDRQRQAMIAVGINGVPIEEVARRMGTNRNALYKLMHDGRLRLKKRLAHEGLTVEDVYAIFENK